MFQRESSPQSNKTLVSQVSEGSRSMRLPLRPVTSRSSEDLLRDSWLSAEEMVVQTQNVDQDLTVPDCVSPSLPCPELSTGSSVLESLNSESLTSNSALESPDSWADSDSAVMVETFGEDQRVCSACDSRTCECVKPVLITTPDEGFSPSTEEEPQPEPTTTETSTDKVIYFQRSSEKTPDEFQDFPLHQEVPEVKREEENLPLVSHPVEELTECSRAEVTKIIDSELVDSGSSLMNKEVLDEKAGPPDSAEEEKLIKCDDGTETTTFYQQLGNTEGATPEENVTECVDSGDQLLEEADDQHDDHLLNNESRTLEKSPHQKEMKLSKDVEPDVTSDKDEISSNLHGSFTPVTSEAPAKISPAHCDQPSPTSLDPNPGRSSALPPTSTDPEELDVQKTHDMEKHVTKENKDFSIESWNQTDVDEKKDSGVYSFTVTEHIEPTVLSLDDGNKMESDETAEDASLLVTNQIQGNTTEQELEECSSKNDTDSKGNIKTSLENPQSDSMETGCGTNQLDQKLDGGTISQQDPMDPVDLEHSVGEDHSVSAEMERNDSQTYDSVGVSVEPMDIFYPEKEEPVSFEPVDVETQSWPLVLSVAALQPAPATDLLPEGQDRNLGEDLLNVDRQSEQVVDKVTW